MGNLVVILQKGAEFLLPTILHALTLSFVIVAILATYALTFPITFSW